MRFGLDFGKTGGFDRTLKVSGPAVLDVVSGSGRIIVHAAGNETVSITAKIRVSDPKPGAGAMEEVRRIEQNPPVEQDGNTIRIKKVDNPEPQRKIRIDYDLAVPAQTRLMSRTGSSDQTIKGLRLPLSAKSGSGNITLDDIAAPVSVSSGSGDIRIHSTRESLEAVTGSGNLWAADPPGESSVNASAKGGTQKTEAADFRVKVGSGNVNIRGAKGRVHVNIGSGNMSAEGVPTSNWHVVTGSGSIRVKVPPQSSFILDAHTASGRVTSKHPLTTSGVAASRGRLYGKAGDGGVTLDLRSGSGNIEIA